MPSERDGNAPPTRRDDGGRHAEPGPAHLVLHLDAVREREHACVDVDGRPHGCRPAAGALLAHSPPGRADQEPVDRQAVAVVVYTAPTQVDRDASDAELSP